MVRGVVPLVVKVKALSPYLACVPLTWVMVLRGYQTHALLPLLALVVKGHEGGVCGRSVVVVCLFVSVWVCLCVECV